MWCVLFQGDMAFDVKQLHLVVSDENIGSVFGCYGSGYRDEIYKKHQHLQLSSSTT